MMDLVFPFPSIEQCDEEMTFEYHLGQRLSFDKVICTVRFLGPVDGAAKEWMGVEGADP